jgi:carboxylesterase type B
MTIILKHGSMGEVHGVLEENVAQFLGIKYAWLQHKFAKSKIVEYGAATGVVDATKMGYIYSPSSDNHF